MKKQIKLLSMAVLLASAAYGADLDQTERCSQMIRAAKEEAARTAVKTKEERIAEYESKAGVKLAQDIYSPIFAGLALSTVKQIAIRYAQVLFSIDDRTAELDAEVGILGKHVQQLGGELVDATRAAAEALAFKDAANARLAKENAEKDARIAELLAQVNVLTAVKEANDRSQEAFMALMIGRERDEERRRNRVPSAAPVRKIRDETSATPSLDVVQEASK